MDFLFWPAMFPVWVMLIVALLESIWRWPEKYHPISLFRLIAQRMADKVHPPSPRSHYQQQISGALACLVLWLPTVVILQLLKYLVEFPLLFDGVLLLAALQFQPVLDTSKKLEQRLIAEQKTWARQTLTPWVLRHTEQLSPLGMGKACIESMLLRFQHQYLATLFWFAVAGGAGAFGYRLLYEFSHQWHTRRPRFSQFGQFTARLIYLLQWLPARILVLPLLIGEGITSALKARWRDKNRINSTRLTLLSLCGGALGIQLGGPAFYNEHKTRLPKCGGLRELRFGDIARTRMAIIKAKVILLCLLLFFGALSFAAYQLHSGRLHL